MVKFYKWQGYIFPKYSIAKDLSKQEQNELTAFIKEHNDMVEVNKKSEEDVIQELLDVINKMTYPIIEQDYYCECTITGDTVTLVSFEGNEYEMTKKQTIAMLQTSIDAAELMGLGE